jgi:hypothetical protein
VPLVDAAHEFRVSLTHASIAVVVAAPVSPETALNVAVRAMLEVDVPVASPYADSDVS